MIRSCRNKAASAHLRMMSFNITLIKVRKFTVHHQSFGLFMFALFVFVRDKQDQHCRCFVQRESYRHDEHGGCNEAYMIGDMTMTIDSAATSYYYSGMYCYRNW